MKCFSKGIKTSMFFLFMVFTFVGFGQNKTDDQKFQHFSLLTDNDTLHYHIFSHDLISDKTQLLVFIHGSGPFPMYTITQENNEKSIVSTVPFDLEQMPNNVALVMVSKKGIPFSVNTSDFKPDSSYYQNETLDYRVNQYDQVIHHLVQHQFKKATKVMAIGHSEGSDVVAKLGIINKELTHIGFWSGSGATQYNDFALFIRQEVHEGKINETEAAQKLKLLLEQIALIEQNPEAIDQFWLDNTYKRWHSFSEPALQNLLQISIPLFVAIGAQDQAVPVASTLLIPIEFLRFKKTNLTFQLYPNLDHGFESVPAENEEAQDHWMSVFKDFIDWTDVYPNTEKTTSSTN